MDFVCLWLPLVVCGGQCSHYRKCLPGIQANQGMALASDSPDYRNQGRPAVARHSRVRRWNLPRPGRRPARRAPTARCCICSRNCRIPSLRPGRCSPNWLPCCSTPASVPCTGWMTPGSRHSSQLSTSLTNHRTIGQEQLAKTCCHKRVCQDLQRFQTPARLPNDLAIFQRAGNQAPVRPRGRVPGHLLPRVGLRTRGSAYQFRVGTFGRCGTAVALDGARGRPATGPGHQTHRGTGTACGQRAESFLKQPEAEMAAQGALAGF